MTNRLLRLATFGAYAVLVACAAGNSAPARLAEAPARAVQPAAPAPEHGPAALSTSLTPELLYHVLIGEIAGQRGQLGVAAGAYLRAARISDDPRVAERATRVAVYARDEAAALAAAERWSELQPDNLEARHALATLYIRGGRLDRAIEQLEQVIAMSEGAGQAFSLIATWLSREPDQTAIASLMRQLTERHADDPDVLFAYAQYALHTGQLDDALPHLQRALSLRPSWPEALILRAHVRAHQGDLDGALAELGAVVEQSAGDTQLRLTYARMLVDAKRLDGARAQFDLLAQQAPEDPDVLYAASLLSLEAQRLDEAGAYLQRLVALGERLDEAHYYLGRIAETREQYAQARRWYARVQDAEYQLDAQIRVASLLSKEGNLPGAREHLAMLRGQEPAEAPRLYVAEGELLREAGRYHEAMHLYNEAVLMLPDDSDLLYARALIAERIDRIDVVEQDLRAIVERDPSHAHALNALGYTLADRTDRYQEALEYIERALELLPDDPAVIDSMGWVQYRLGNLEAALQYLREAYERSDDGEIAAHLGEVLWVLGERAEAEEIWSRGLQKDPENSLLLEVMKRLSE
jgi:tetratricopeptide (TPR) repeat protein